MRKSLILSFLACIALTVCLTGCATVKIEAPQDRSVMLQPNVLGQTKLMKKKVWYVLWGLVPITNNSTGNMVKEMDIHDMSIRSYYGVDDCIIMFVLNLIPTTLHVKSVEIRGE